MYRARDTKLDRDVALKVLPQAFTDDPDRLARFEREFKVLASLNHPNIGHIYGLEEAEGQKALVLELVEGPTLADRIERGPIPVDEALPIAKQIAEALEAAHEQGVIHRDLKPANVKVRPDGTVKVLDFGLAKAVDTAPEGDPSQSPTLTAAATQMGVIMGTAAYMSPEQARGRSVDKRADIWAFGCVFYEMLTGQKAFEGDDVSLTLSAVLQREPDWSLLPPLPAPVRRVLERCLTKDAGRRQRDAGDAGLDLEAALEDTRRSRVGGWLPWTMAALFGVTVLVLASRDVAPPGVETRTRRFALDLPWQTMPNWSDFRVRISPQGTHLAYPGSDENRTTIDLRPLDSLDAVAVVSPMADPWNLAFSPDGEHLAFFIGNQLHTVSIFGGQPESLYEAQDVVFEGMSWGSEGDILLSQREGLMRVPVSTGEATLVVPAEDDRVFLDPFHLPNGTHALVPVGQPVDGGRLAVVDLTAGTQLELPLQGREPIYSPTGHILFRQSGELFPCRFDIASLEVVGSAVSMVSGVAYGPRLSDDGTLVYVADRAQGSAGLVWVNREGIAAPIAGERRDYLHIDLSGDGTQALLQVQDDIYASDINRGSRNWSPRAGCRSGILMASTSRMRTRRTSGSHQRVATSSRF